MNEGRRWALQATKHPNPLLLRSWGTGIPAAQPWSLQPSPSWREWSHRPEGNAWPRALNRYSFRIDVLFFQDTNAFLFLFVFVLVQASRTSWRPPQEQEGRACLEGCLTPQLPPPGEEEVRGVKDGIGQNNKVTWHRAEEGIPVSAWKVSWGHELPYSLVSYSTHFCLPHFFFFPSSSSFFFSLSPILNVSPLSPYYSIGQ